MERTRTLAAALLLALLVTVALSLPDDPRAVAVEPGTVVAKLTIPAAAFSLAPQLPYDYRYFNDGSMLYSWGSPLPDQPMSFLAPVEYPVQKVSVRGLTLYAYDHDGTAARLCASVHRTTLAWGTAGEKQQAQVCTVESAVYPQVAKYPYRIAGGAVDAGTNGSYVRVDFWGVPSTPYPYLFAVQITYAYEVAP